MSRICPICGEDSTVEDWNRQTLINYEEGRGRILDKDRDRVYGEDIILMDNEDWEKVKDRYYPCPICERFSKVEDLKIGRKWS